VNDRFLTPSTDSPYWRGAIDWVPDDQWWQPWRLLPEHAGRAHAPALLEGARMPAGVRAELRTDATALRLPIEYTSHDRPGRIDVLLNGELHTRVDLPVGTTTVHVPLPEGEHDVQVWLPQSGAARIGRLGLDGPTTISPLATRPRWVTYGSSITVCSAASGPSRTWPALAARRWGWDLTCLGFSGQCHLDPIAARTIAATPADLISLCLGINVHNAATYNERTFAPHVSGFIEQVRQAHPGVPIAVITPIASPEREDQPSDAGLTLGDIRRAVTEVVQVLQADDDGLHLVDGLQILQPAEAHLMPDGLHPDAQGYELMAERLAPVLGSLAAHAVAGGQA